MTIQQVIEALVFASPKPLTAKEIAAALRAAANGSEDQDALAFGKVKEAAILAILEELKIGYISGERAFQLVEKASGWQIVSHPDYGLWVRQLYPESKPARLSGPALETLAIIAYRQPITKADIEAVRGVSVDGMVQMLLERSLVRIAGRAELPGRPLLYETTQYFMEHFGLRSLDELPNSDELRRINLPKAAQPELPAETEEKPANDEVEKADANGEKNLANHEENSAPEIAVSESTETQSAALDESANADETANDSSPTKNA